MRQRLGLAFALVVVAGMAGWFLFRPNPERNALRIRELATRGLAEYLAGRRAGERVVIVSNPFTERAGAAREIVETEQAGIRGLRAGFGRALTVAAVAFPELRPGALDDPRALLGDVETSTPLSYLMSPGAMDKLARQHPDAQLLVSLVGLPPGLGESEGWNAAGPPRFALLWPDLRLIGDTAAVVKALKSGKLAAAVLRRPGAPDDLTPLGKERQAEFEKRFLLLTSETVEQTLRSYPGLF
jgi:hypothetical protein